MIKYNPEFSADEFKEDVDRMIQVLKNQWIDATAEQVWRVWEDYSSQHYAWWLGLSEDDSYIFKILMEYHENNNN